MRAPFIAAVLCVLVCGAGYVALPYHSASQLRQAIETSDVALLDRKVHWQSVRSSLKEQLTASMMKDIGTGGRNQGAQMLGAGLATMMMDKMIDGLVSPAGFTQLIHGNARPGEKPQLRDNLIRRAGLVSPARFEIELGEQGKQKRMIGIMEPFGFEWKLSQVLIVQ